MLTIGFPKTKLQFVNGYLCRDGIGTMAIWLGRRKDIYHGKCIWETVCPTCGEVGCFYGGRWLECELMCELMDDAAYSSEGHEIAKADWPKPGKCVKVKVLVR